MMSRDLQMACRPQNRVMLRRIITRYYDLAHYFASSLPPFCVALSRSASFPWKLSGLICDLQSSIFHLGFILLLAQDLAIVPFPTGMA
jgi:hypothetical protein